MTARTVAAVDLGAESGRVTAVSLDNGTLSVEIANRFANTPRVSDGLLRWNIRDLWSNIESGLGALAAGSQPVSSVGVDTWGVDYGLLSPTGELQDDPVSYRDDRNAQPFADALAALGPERIYQATGVQILGINTVFGLMADARDRPERLAGAKTLLMMPDVFHHRLSGSLVSEYTAVSTTGAYDMAGNRWATELLDELGVPTHMLPEVAPPGTDVGPLIGSPATGALSGARVILPPGHDTASAVVGVPFAEPGGLFISSGTWSLVGIEVPEPVVSAATQRANMTNEGGYAGTIRLLRNVMGLWILQECRRQWAREGTALQYTDLVEMASAATGVRTVINPDAPEFLAPGDMPSRIRTYCARRGLPVPESIGELARCVLDSLALSYRAVVDDLELVTGRRPGTVNIVGGGANNALLSQLTADATGLPVQCGPVEATALGNGAAQLAALGEFDGPADIRAAISASTEMRSYLPRPGYLPDQAIDDFRRLRTGDLAGATATTGNTG